MEESRLGLWLERNLPTLLLFIIRIVEVFAASIVPSGAERYSYLSRAEREVLVGAERFLFYNNNGCKLVFLA